DLKCKEKQIPSPHMASLECEMAYGPDRDSEDWSLVPVTLVNVCNSSSGGSDALFWPPQVSYQWRCEWKSCGDQLELIPVTGTDPTMMTPPSRHDRSLFSVKGPLP
ncbi:hypothetical protein STEG23_016547, partial [Scotinomys teguina]